MKHVMFFGLAVVCAIFLAILEIQIEGNQGWAASLPTWQVQNQWTDWLLAGRPLTGYHTYLLLFMITLAHLPFFIGLGWTLRKEALVLGFLMLMFLVLEDFFWFVLNPDYGLAKFRPEYIWWHQQSWLWVCPREYFVFLPLSIILYLFGQGFWVRKKAEG
jgi:hypothetical protein